MSAITWKPRLKVYRSSPKNTFEPESFEARSYGHWCYMTKIKGQIVFNDYSYSMTTNKHQWEMKSFMRETLKINMKKVIFVDQRQSLTHGIFLDSIYEKQALAEIRFKAKGRRAQFYKDQKEIIAKCISETKKLKRIGAKSEMSLIAHRKAAKVEELDRLSRQRVKAQAAKVKRLALVTEHKADFESLDAVAV